MSQPTPGMEVPVDAPSRECIASTGSDSLIPQDSSQISDSRVSSDRERPSSVLIVCDTPTISGPEKPYNDRSPSKPQSNFMVDMLNPFEGILSSSPTISVRPFHQMGLQEEFPLGVLREAWVDFKTNTKSTPEHFDSRPSVEPTNDILIESVELFTSGRNQEIRFHFKDPRTPLPGDLVLKSNVVKRNTGRHATKYKRLLSFKHFFGDLALSSSISHCLYFTTERPPPAPYRHSFDRPIPLDPVIVLIDMISSYNSRLRSEVPILEVLWVVMCPSEGRPRTHAAKVLGTDRIGSDSPTGPRLPSAFFGSDPEARDGIDAYFNHQHDPTSKRSEPEPDFHNKPEIQQAVEYLYDNFRSQFRKLRYDIHSSRQEHPGDMRNYRNNGRKSQLNMANRRISATIERYENQIAQLDATQSPVSKLSGVTQSIPDMEQTILKLQKDIEMLKAGRDPTNSHQAAESSDKGLEGVREKPETKVEDKNPGGLDQKEKDIAGDGMGKKAQWQVAGHELAAVEFQTDPKKDTRHDSKVEKGEGNARAETGVQTQSTIQPETETRKQVETGVEARLETGAERVITKTVKEDSDLKEGGSSQVVGEKGG
ncbi:hypothetical protein RHS03_06641, partial [Rhizoctonia solani]